MLELRRWIVEDSNHGAGEDFSFKISSCLVMHILGNTFVGKAPVSAKVKKQHLTFEQI